MEIKIKFLGALSVNFGTEPVSAESGPDYESLRRAILSLTGDQCSAGFVILKNGRPVMYPDPIEEGDEFVVFSPISGG